jgi:hypothetical protein
LLLSPFPEFRGHLSCGLPVAHEDRPLEVALYDDPEGGFRVAFHGIVTCGSPWICPVCSPSLAERRGEALARTLAHFMALGFRVAHAVLTIRHARAVVEVGWLPSDRAAYAYALVESDEDVHEVGRYIAKASSGWGVGAEVAGGARKDSKGGLSPFTLLATAWWGYLEDPESMASWFPEGKDDLEDPAPWLPGARRLAEGGPLILRELCRASSQTAIRLGISPEEASYRWLEYAEATKGRRALTFSRSLTRPGGGSPLRSSAWLAMSISTCSIVAGWPTWSIWLSPWAPSAWPAS